MRRCTRRRRRRRVRVRHTGKLPTLESAELPRPRTRSVRKRVFHHSRFDIRERKPERGCSRRIDNSRRRPNVRRIIAATASKHPSNSRRAAATANTTLSLAKRIRVIRLGVGCYASRIRRARRQRAHHHRARRHRRSSSSISTTTFFSSPEFPRHPSQSRDVALLQHVRSFVRSIDPTRATRKRKRIHPSSGVRLHTERSLARSRRRRRSKTD